MALKRKKSVSGKRKERKKHGRKKNKKKKNNRKKGKKGKKSESTSRSDDEPLNKGPYGFEHPEVIDVRQRIFLH